MLAGHGNPFSVAVSALFLSVSCVKKCRRLGPAVIDVANGDGLFQVSDRHQNRADDRPGLFSYFVFRRNHLKSFIGSDS